MPWCDLFHQAHSPNKMIVSTDAKVFGGIPQIKLCFPPTHIVIKKKKNKQRNYTYTILMTFLRITWFINSNVGHIALVDPQRFSALTLSLVSRPVLDTG